MGDAEFAHRAQMLHQGLTPGAQAETDGGRRSGRVLSEIQLHGREVRLRRLGRQLLPLSPSELQRPQRTEVVEGCVRVLGDPLGGLLGMSGDRNGHGGAGRLRQNVEAPVVVADAGYGVCTPFRLGLKERGLAYVLALTGKEVAHPENALPHQPDYGGLGPPTLPRYRTPPHAVSVLASEAGDGRFTEVTWRRGSKGVMTSRFAVMTVRPAGKQSLAAVQEAGGGRNRWDGVLPARTLLVEWPDGQDAPTGYWISNLPVTTPVTDLVRWAKMRWRIEHDYRELKHGLGLDHFEGRTWRGWHHHVTLVTAAQAFLTFSSMSSGLAEVLDRHLHHLRPTTHHTQNQTQNLTKHY
nr:transposase [Streptomyces sp. WAC06273]